MKPRYFLVALVIFILGLVGLNYVNSNRFQWVTAQQKMRGPFFRMDVKLKYKGEPLDMSFVVACHGRITQYADHSTSSEVGLTPTVYGRRMSDGQAVVVRAPDVCDGMTTASGQVLPTFMPIIVVFPDADKMDFGMAYVADDAYEGPLSQLTFISTTITVSTQEAWEEFRKNGIANAVSRDEWWSQQADGADIPKGIKDVYPNMGTLCEYRRKFEIPEIIKPLLRASPSYRAGEYWSPSTLDEFGSTFGMMRGHAKINGEQVKISTEADPTPRLYGDYISASNPDGGVNRQDGRSMMDYNRFFSYIPRAPLYPTAQNFASNQWPGEPELWPAALARLKTLPGYYTDIQGGKYRGFAYCTREPYRRGVKWPESDIYKQIPHVSGFNVVDGRQIFTIPPISKYLIYQTGKDPIFYGDEYVLEYLVFSLSSYMGDV